MVLLGAVAEAEAEDLGAVTVPLPLSVGLASAFELSDLVEEVFAAGAGSVGLSFVSGMKPAPTKRITDYD